MQPFAIENAWRAFGVSALLLAAAAPAAAQDHSEEARVKSAAQAFYSALSARDIAAMEQVWSIDSPTFLINPRDRAPTVGWQAAKANWNGAFAFWSALKVTPRDMAVRVTGNSAAVASLADVQGTTKAGKPMTFTALNTQVFENRGGKWLLVSHHSSQAPD